MANPNRAQFTKCASYAIPSTTEENFFSSFVVQIPPFPDINMDKFNYLQPLNNDNDLLAAELLLADDFPTYDFSLKQIVADFSPHIAAVPHGIKSTGTKTTT